MKKLHKKATVSLAIALFVLMGVGTYGILRGNTDTAPATTSDQANAPKSTNESVPSPTSAKKTTEDQLLYLIEEEKLAHDVYTVMHQKYGANVFGNILQSETTHQSRVLTLLQARAIADPRSTELGVFKNQELQDLYNQLIKQGEQQASEAYKVGVIIEEKDIADISTQLATATDEDIIQTLESLREASENHLRAFNRQL